MKKINLVLLAGCFSLNLLAQHNYDNQSVIYSNNGDIGIGTANPSNKLDVEGNINGTTVIEVTNTNSGNLARRGISVGNGLSGHSAYLLSTSANYTGVQSLQNSGVLGTDSQLLNGLVLRSSTGGIRFQPGGVSDKIVFKDNGSVGIGTTDPNAKLTIGNIGSVNNIKLLGFGEGSVSGFWFGSGFSPNGSDNYVVFNSNEGNIMTWKHGGDVGIGTTNPDAKLAVKGDIHVQEVRVDLNGAVAPDLVFEPDYNLRTLAETEAYIKENKHLPEIPSAVEMEENGIELKTMNLKLLQKIEELTLYTIKQQKSIETQQKQLQLLQKQINELKQ